MFPRRLALPSDPEQSFFLWGPRQTGKSSLLRATYPAAIWIDLLKTDEFARYAQRPARLREELLAVPGRPVVVIDEVQKVPALLDEVHWLIENRGLRFVLCGSSARKVRRGAANLLGGRAVRHELYGLVSAEIGGDFDLERMVNHGYLPRHYLSRAPAPLLRAYVNDYLKEEIAAEGLVRRLPAFASFLSAAVLTDTGRDKAVAVAERIREGFAQASQEVDGRPVCSTVSIGLVHCEAAVLDVPELLAQADQALYHAKERGRNRVEVATLDMLLDRKNDEQRSVQSSATSVAAIGAKSAA